MQQHYPATTVAILGADTVVGRAHCALLEGSRYRTTPIDAYPTGVVDDHTTDRPSSSTSSRIQSRFEHLSRIDPASGCGCDLRRLLSSVMSTYQASPHSSRLTVYLTVYDTLSL